MDDNVYRQGAKRADLMRIQTVSYVPWRNGTVEGEGLLFPAYHCPICVLQDRFTIEAHVNSRHEITKHKNDDTRVIDTSPEIRRMRRTVHERMIQSRDAETN